MKFKLGDVGHTDRKQYYWAKKEDIKAIFQKIMSMDLRVGGPETEYSKGFKDGVLQLKSQMKHEIGPELLE